MTKLAQKLLDKEGGVVAALVEEVAVHEEAAVHVDDIWSGLKATAAPINEEAILERRVQMQIEEYKSLPQISMKEKDVYTNPLDWWRIHEPRFPLVAELSRRILCIPATSASSERVFSAAGLTISKKRASLNPDTAADLIFLNGSWAQAEKYNNSCQKKRSFAVSGIQDAFVEILD